LIAFLPATSAAHGESTGEPTSEPALGGPTEPKKPEPGFLRRLAGDFGKMFTSRDSLCVLGIGGSLALMSAPADDRIQRSQFNSELYPQTSLDGVFEGGDVAGDAPVLAGSAVAILVAGTLAGDARLKGLGGDLVRAQIVSGSVTLLIKYATHRERPDGSDQLSLPSGHASVAFATATVFQRRYGVKVGAPAYLVATWIAASRLNENKHFLSDVVLGASIGIAAGRAATARGRSRRVVVTPQIVPDGGVGVQFMLVGRS
jgi:hypothetical protein